MTGLTLTLKPREKFLVAGHLMENGPKRSSIKIASDDTRVLRLSDALHPNEVDTPLKRTYFVAQQILACELSVEEGAKTLEEHLKVLTPIFVRAGFEDPMARIAVAVIERRFFGVLMALRNLFEAEAIMLGLDTTQAEAETASEDVRAVAVG